MRRERAARCAAATSVSLRDILAATGSVFEFRADQPLRYLALVVARFTRIGDGDVVHREPDRPRLWSRLDCGQRCRRRTAFAHRAGSCRRTRRASCGSTRRSWATSRTRRRPSRCSKAICQADTAPATSRSSRLRCRFATANWRGDPASFENFPEFFLAHELAHQWWGQAVGWKNYHEQWISEGFAQYFAALYAQKSRGDRVFIDMLRQFRRWSLSDSDQGPVHLGYRLGLVKGNVRVFRALVYNKGAAVLHMLRRLLGDEVFFRGLRRFYMDAAIRRPELKTSSGRWRRSPGGCSIASSSGGFTARHSPHPVQHADRRRQVVVRFEQAGDQVFDMPVTVTITYANGRTSDVVVPVSDSQVERSIPTDDLVRQVQVNRDSAALAEFDEG